MNCGKAFRLITINASLFSFLFLGSLEIFLRTRSDDFGTSWISAEYHSLIEEAAEASSLQDDLTLVVGDSFGAYQKGRGTNMFDIVYGCNSNKNCKYYNVSIPGTDTPAYWNSINYILKDRPVNAKTKIIMVLYYGSDFHITDKDRKACEYVYSGKNIAPILNIERGIKSRLLSLTYVYRFFKQSMSFGRYNKQRLEEFAEEMLDKISDWPRKEFSDTLSRVPEHIQRKVRNDVLSPWQVALAMANPSYYQELYSMSKDWSREAIYCTSKSISTNIRPLKARFPNLNFTVLGFPDKFYWNLPTSVATLREFRDLGFLMDNHQDSAIEKISSHLIQLANENDINFLSLPLIIADDETDISGYFYPHDMHLNRLGNKQLANKLRHFIESRQSAAY